MPKGRPPSTAVGPSNEQEKHVSKLTDLLIKTGIAQMDPDPEPANPRWAEALLDSKDSKESDR
jgi:hypothetical protein